MDTRDSFQPISRDVLLDSYALPGEQSVDEVRRRIAQALAAAEAPAEQADWTARFLQVQRAGFIAGGRIAAHAGAPSRGTMVSCFVQPMADSISHPEDGCPAIWRVCPGCWPSTRAATCRCASSMAMSCSVARSVAWCAGRS